VGTVQRGTHQTAAGHLTMAPFKKIPRLLRGRAAIRTDVDEEIEAHLEETTRTLIATGLDPDAARAEAHRRFGDVATTRRVMTHSAMRQHGRITRRDRFDAFAFDFRYSLRQLRRSPGFTASVVVTLGLGLGANAAMFGLLDRLLLRPPAHVREAEQVRRVYLHIPDGTREALVTEVSYRRLTELQQGASGAIDLAGVVQTPFVAGEGEEAREIRGALASPNFFPMLGVRPHLGRFPLEGPEGAGDLVLGFEWWRSAHGSDSTVIGRAIRIGTGSFTVVGVAPEAFTGIEINQVDAWLPALAAGAIWTHLPPEWPNEHSFSWLSLAGRLRDGASPAQAEELIGVAYRRSLETHGGPDAVGASRSGARLYPVLLQRGPERNDDTKVAIWLGVVAFIVLLLACTNVANLLLARAVDRQGEVAVRLALGAGRSRLVRQLLMETAILAAAGAVAGVVLAQLTERALRVSVLGGVGIADGGLNGRTIAFATVMAILACALSGLWPSWFTTRTDLRAMLTAAGRGIRRSSRFRTTLLVSQTALSTVLLIGAGLFVRSLLTAQSTRLGYDADRLIIMTLRNRSTEPLPGGTSAVYRELAVRARALPEVVAAATTMQVPFAISGNTHLAVPGIDSVERLGNFRINGVGDGYFETAGTRIIRGRALTTDDRKGTPLVMVVSDSMARTLWPGRDAIGQCVKVGGPTFPCSEVVGVAENVQQYEIRQESSLQYWFPESQEQGNNSGAFGVLVRVDGDPVQLAPALRRALLPTLPGTIHLTVRPLGTSVQRAMRPWRLGATMFTAFGALGLLIATVGLFSALAYAVSQRRREFGVRVALGARSSRIVRMVLGQGLRLAIAGVAIGVAIALAAGGRLAPLLLGVGPRDPLVTIGVAVALGLTAMIAGLIPAWRASRVDPADALRSE
jgi:putative ABC transport system permease protein